MFVRVMVRTCEHTLKRRDKTMKEKKTVVAENAVAENAVETTAPTNPKTDIVNNADLEKLQKFTAKIELAIRTSESAMRSIMGAVAVIAEKKLYLAEGYKTVKDYMLEKHGFDLKKTAQSEAINTFRRFGDMETGEVKEEYTLYTYSQLKLMQRLPDTLLTQVTPDMSCRKIQELLNSLTAKEEPKQIEETAETPETAETAEKPETSNSRNVSRETHVENSGEVEPYISITYSIAEFAELDATFVKDMIMQAFKNGNNVHMNFKYE